MLEAVDGDWVLHTVGHKSWHVRNLRIGEHIELGKIPEEIEHPQGPFGCMNESKVVWVDEYHDHSGTRNVVKLFDLKTRKEQVLFHAPPIHEIDGVRLEGNYLVYSLVDLKDRPTRGIVDSDIYLFHLKTKKHTRLSTTGMASEPDISWPFLVWKTNVLFSSGGIFLYDLRTKKGFEVASVQNQNPVAPISYDFPSISKHGAIWAPFRGGEVILYSPSTKKIKAKLEPKGYGQAISGRYAVWISETLCKEKTEQGTNCLSFADLGDKNEGPSSP